MYIDAENLRTLIAQTQQTGQVSDDLAHLICLITTNLARKYPWVEVDDLTQDTFIHFVRYYGKCDCTRSPKEVFNWLTSLVINLIRLQARWRVDRARHLADYAVALGEDVPQN